MQDNRSELFLMAKKGNIKAYEQLIESYERKIFNLVLSFSKDRNQASEMAQEVFLNVYRRLMLMESERMLASAIYKSAGDMILKYNFNR